MSYFPCPNCDGILNLKQAKNGPRKGEYFYGCKNFMNTQVNCKVTVDKDKILDYLHKELFDSKKIPLPSNKLLWTIEELENFNEKQLVILCNNNGYDVGFEKDKENLISLINYFQTTYYRFHYSNFVFSKVISSDYFLNFKYVFNIYELNDNLSDDLALKTFLKNNRNKKIKIFDYLNNIIGEAKFSKTSIDLNFSNSIYDASGFELLTIIDMEKTYCKCVVVSGEATLDIFNIDNEYYFQTISN